MSQIEAKHDEQDAKRWRAVCQRHGAAMMQIAIGSNHYRSDTKQKILDAWADMAAAEIEGFDPDIYWKDVASRIEELERGNPN